MKLPALILAAALALSACSERNHCSDRGDIPALSISRQFAEARLRSPASADFASIRHSNIRRVGECGFIVTSYVDAQNGFGAIVRTRYIAHVEYDPAAQVWRLLDLAM